MKAEYLKYGAAFASSIGSAHGGNAKIVGNVTHVNSVPVSPPPSSSSSSTMGGSGSTATALGKDGQVEEGKWDEIALAHYPSILHFRDMLQSEKYQEVNQRHRVPSLRDTCILMTSEIAVEEMMKAGGGAKL